MDNDREMFVPVAPGTAMRLLGTPDQQLDAMRKALKQANKEALDARLALQELREEVADCPHGHHHPRETPNGRPSPNT